MKLCELMSNIWQVENKDDVDILLSKDDNKITFVSPVNPLSIFNLFLQVLPCGKSLKMFNKIRATPHLHHLPGMKQLVEYTFSWLVGWQKDL